MKMAEEDSEKKAKGEMGSGSFPCLGSTVESLRGRLLAERQGSRVANEEAELQEGKLRELEKKLKQETKLRRKAEKKLQFLMKKLHSFTNISSSLTSQELYCSISETSLLSSTINTSSSSPKDPEQEDESEFPKRIPEISSLSRHCKNTDADDQRHYLLCPL